ncbi:hypothetical protein N0V93_010348 [Gnomoniopsis smithogilvyi]|uniref:Uncharacterized protein n=1 Tax=Gnomoniopsis smithogilvyi TaxID=1191159 RepID=A0A9W8YIS8_9PEZI|nr:hypothetical protein N0V93_010348 [Gnomoniopsis smithogilvyi]
MDPYDRGSGSSPRASDSSDAAPSNRLPTGASPSGVPGTPLPDPDTGITEGVPGTPLPDPETGITEGVPGTLLPDTSITEGMPGTLLPDPDTSITEATDEIDLSALYKGLEARGNDVNGDSDIRVVTDAEFEKKFPAGESFSSLLKRWLKDPTLSQCVRAYTRPEPYFILDTKEHTITWFPTTAPWVPVPGLIRVWVRDFPDLWKPLFERDLDNSTPRKGVPDVSATTDGATSPNPVPRLVNSDDAPVNFLPITPKDSNKRKSGDPGSSSRKLQKKRVDIGLDRLKEELNRA